MLALFLEKVRRDLGCLERMKLNFISSSSPCPMYRNHQWCPQAGVILSSPSPSLYTLDRIAGEVKRAVLIRTK